MENRVGRSDGVGSVAMPPVEGVESDALDEASGLQSSSSRAPNADAGFADGVQTDLPMAPVPPPESPCLDEVPCPEVVPAGSCDEIQLQPDYPVAPTSEPAGSDAEEPRPHDAVVPGDPVEPAGSDAVEPRPHDAVVPGDPVEPAGSEIKWQQLTRMDLTTFRATNLTNGPYLYMQWWWYHCQDSIEEPERQEQLGEFQREEKERCVEKKGVASKPSA